MAKKLLVGITLIIIAFLGFYYFPAKETNGPAKRAATLTTNSTKNNMKITSPSFSHNGPIPAKYTCDGENINPELLISEVPQTAESLVLIVDDPDAPLKTWLHWTLWNISPSANRIPENAFPEGSIEGITDFGKTGWGGPCPPSGEHRYFFKLYALDSTLDLPTGASLTELEKAMEGHIIDSAELVGLYSRK
jgi:hypothetical protein